MGKIFNFFKVKKNSLDVFLSKKLSVEEKLNYALSELDKRAFQYKENLIDLVARRDSLSDSLSDFKKKVESVKKEASTLKAEGKESLAKSKIMVMLSYQQAADELEKTYKEISKRVDDNKNILIKIDAKKEVLAAQAELIKTKASITGVNVATIDFEDISKLIRGVEIDVNARTEVEETVASTKPADEPEITTDEVDKIYAGL
jgi:phage shock protein A